MSSALDFDPLTEALDSAADVDRDNAIAAEQGRNRFEWGMVGEDDKRPTRCPVCGGAIADCEIGGGQEADGTLFVLIDCKIRKLAARRRESRTRRRGVLLKDLEPKLLEIMTDEAKDRCRPGDRRLAYLRWATRAQVEAIARWLPSLEMKLPPRTRGERHRGAITPTVKAFPYVLLIELLRVGGVTRPEKYVRVCEQQCLLDFVW